MGLRWRDFPSLSRYLSAGFPPQFGGPQTSSISCFWRVLDGAEAAFLCAENFFHGLS
jgi:hypothetical protein